MRSCTSSENHIPSLRISLTIEMTNEDKHRLCLQKLKALDDKCLQAQQQIELYQDRISKQQESQRTDL